MVWCYSRYHLKEMTMLFRHALLFLLVKARQKLAYGRICASRWYLQSSLLILDRILHQLLHHDGCLAE